MFANSMHLKYRDVVLYVLVESLPEFHPQPCTKWGVVTHTWNSSTLELKAARIEDQYYQQAK